jgi:hypothetical protein
VGDGFRRFLAASVIAAISALTGCDRGDGSTGTVAPSATIALPPSASAPSARATAGPAAPSIDPSADTAQQGVELLGLVAELAVKEGADCDRFGDELERLLGAHVDLLQALAKKSASQTLAERKAEDAKYAEEEADFERRAGPVLTRCAPNPKVQAAMSKIP